MAVTVCTVPEFHAEKPWLLFDGAYVGQGGEEVKRLAPAN